MDESLGKASVCSAILNLIFSDLNQQTILLGNSNEILPFLGQILQVFCWNNSEVFSVYFK